MHPWRTFSSRSTLVSAKVVALSTGIGATLGGLRSSPDTVWTDIWAGALTGLVISVCCLIAEFQVFSNPKFRMARRVRPIFLMAVRGAAYSLFIIFGLFLPGLVFDVETPWLNPGFAERFIISSGIAFSFSVGVEITRLLGKEAMVALISGRYTRARLENRTILFADVINSTALAETIGQLRFHDFLRDVALDLAEAVELARGDVHKYVGDAIIVTWPGATAASCAAGLTCAKEMHRILAHRSAYYKETYGTEARIRVAIHCGQVAAGEIGDWKKEIALLGDPMNTAARIEKAAKAFDASIVLSDEVARQLSEQASQRLTRLPVYQAPGKKEELVLWSA